MKTHRLTRRHVLATALIGCCPTVLSGRYAALAAAGTAETHKLDVHDPAAVALAYVENAADVDQKKSPSFIKGSNCENCLQLLGDAGSDYRPCSLFVGKVVAVRGWCSGWTAEM